MTVFLYLKLLTVTTGNRHNKTKQRTGSNQIFKIVLFSRACFSRTRLTLKMEAFSFVGLTPNGRPWSQAFLAENVETGDNNRDDFHCMQMSLVMSMPFIFGDVWNDALCSIIIPVRAVKRNLRSRRDWDPVHTKTIVNANASKRIFLSPSTRKRSSFT